jgi:hypothetical protein
MNSSRLYRWSNGLLNCAAIQDAVLPVCQAESAMLKFIIEYSNKV